MAQISHQFVVFAFSVLDPCLKLFVLGREFVKQLLVHVEDGLELARFPHELFTQLLGYLPLTRFMLGSLARLAVLLLEAFVLLR